MAATACPPPAATPAGRTPRPGRWPQLAALLATALLLPGCDYPRDPDGTLEKVRGGVLQVGVVSAPPWVRSDDGAVSGPEAELASRIAASVGARVEWRDDTMDSLMQQLEERELGLVIGGLTERSPWRSHVALSIPHAEDRRDGRLHRHVLALPPGENAWQMQVESVIRDATAEASR